MRAAIFLLAAAIVPAGAQLGTMKQAPPAAVKSGTVGAAGAPLQTMQALEKDLDGRIASTGGADPCVIWGGTRGVVVNGLGAIFTAEVELAATPGGVGLFQATVGPEQKAKILKNKLAHVPLLEQTMRDMVLSLSASPALRLADTDQVVVAVRLWYRPWEDRSGLPGEIVMRLDHRGGVPKMDVQ